MTGLLREGVTGESNFPVAHGGQVEVLGVLQK